VLLASTLPELLPPADGLPAVAGLRTGLRVTAALRRPEPDPARLAALGRAAARAVHGEVAWLGEREAKALLHSAGLPVPDGRLVRSADEAAAAQAELAAPVAFKATGLRHKSEHGGVELGVADASAARAAYDRLCRLDGGPVLVERMAAPGAELLVAARADGVVPALVVGLGGLWTEALDDVAVLPLPAGSDRVEAALRGLRGAVELTGGRGRAALDVAAAARLAAAAGELLLDEGLALLELNPVIVHREGAVAVDALAARPALVPTATGGRP
jgi:succinyl-CoA synthetase beta subunit